MTMTTDSRGPFIEREMFAARNQADRESMRATPAVLASGQRGVIVTFGPGKLLLDKAAAERLIDRVEAVLDQWILEDGGDE